MTQEIICILVDLSRDFSCADGLVNIEPDDVYHTTDSMGYLMDQKRKNLKTCPLGMQPEAIYKVELSLKSRKYLIILNQCCIIPLSGGVKHGNR